MSKTIVSVIVPVYNSEATIDRCVDSIVGQTFRDWELILVDDGSSDGSGQRCQAHVSENSHIRYIYKENGGVSSARNRGIKEAAGEYIMFVDSDDWIEPDALETLYNVEAKHNAEIVIPRVRQIHYATDGSFEREVLHDDDYDLFVEGEMIAAHFEKLFHSWALFSLHGILYKRKFLSENHLRFDPSISVLEDFSFNLDCLKYIHTLYHINYVAYNFYVFDFENYKYKRNYMEMMGGIQEAHTHLRQLVVEKKVEYLPAYANFILSYWVQTVQIVSHSGVPSYKKYLVLRSIGRKCRSQALLEHCDRNVVETQYYLLFKTGSPLIYGFVVLCKKIRDKLKEPDGNSIL